MAFKIKKNWWSKHKIWIIPLIIFLCLILIYLATWLVFISNRGASTGEGLTKGDWLVFWGSFLSFVGTTALGYVAIYQNIKQRQDAQNQLKESIKPFLFISYEQEPFRNIILENNGFLHIIFDKKGIIKNCVFRKDLPTDLKKLEELKQNIEKIEIEKHESNDCSKTLQLLKLYKEYNPLNEKLLKKHIKLLYEFKNVGSGNAINIEVTNNTLPLMVPKSINRDETLNLPILIETVDGECKEFSFILNFLYKDIQNNRYEQKFEIYIFKDNFNQPTTRYNPFKEH